MTRAKSKAARSRADGASMFDDYGIPKPATTSSGIPGLSRFLYAEKPPVPLRPAFGTVLREPLQLANTSRPTLLLEQGPFSRTSPQVAPCQIAGASTPPRTPRRLTHRTSTQLAPQPQAACSISPPRPQLPHRSFDIEERLNAQKAQLLSLKRPPPVTRSRAENLLGGCRHLGELLSGESRQARGSRGVAARRIYDSPTTVSEDYRLYRNGRSVEWVRKVQTIQMVVNNDQKTFGTIKEVGADEPLMSSLSGWAKTAEDDDKLLDNTLWTAEVTRFCELLKHRMPNNMRDLGEEGRYTACHVEKRLMLFFVLHHLSDNETGNLDAKKLREFQDRDVPLQAVLTMDKAPCNDCLIFRGRLERLTGIIFKFEVCEQLGQTEVVKHKTRKVMQLVQGGRKPIKTVKTGAYGQKRMDGVANPSAKTPSKRGRPRKAVQNGAYSVETQFMVRRNPAIMVVVPARPQSIPQTPRHRPRSDSSVFLTPPSTPRATRGSGLFTPPARPFSFAALDKIDKRRGFRGPRGSNTNPFVLR